VSLNDILERVDVPDAMNGEVAVPDDLVVPLAKRADSLFQSTFL